MARERLTLDPEADGKVTVRFHKDLLAGEVISGVATVKIQEQTSNNPVTYAEDSVAGLTVTAAVVDAYADDGTTLLGASQAVQVKAVDSDSDDDTPVRGSGYRVLVIATITGRDVPLVAKNPLTIRP